MVFDLRSRESLSVITRETFKAVQEAGLRRYLVVRSEQSLWFREEPPLIDNPIENSESCGNVCGFFHRAAGFRGANA